MTWNGTSRRASASPFRVKAQEQITEAIPEADFQVKS